MQVFYALVLISILLATSCLECLRLLRQAKVGSRRSVLPIWRLRLHGRALHREVEAAFVAEVIPFCRQSREIEANEFQLLRRVRGCDPFPAGQPGLALGILVVQRKDLFQFG